ncbi:MAG: helix-turn-helix domain-containing protein [Proteiniphilum sp.]|jgi:AraC-like DNA-binding protein|uniref:helix-turn-helix domain-containing protein n=1 Tax=Proteiniphilum sp. TaxID=1926877 RepID=UPI002B211CA6|nr:helix-turn-helix domain-containing protein [Proteiniphilum sp.]MEA5129081.1 helix-turn-helix domain-containing protein [Proteiniphilum sp.]
MDVNAKIRTDDVRKYLLTDVASCTFTFSDGLKSKVSPSPESEIVLVKFIPRASKSKRFEDSVLSNYSRARNMNELAAMCKYDCVRTFTRHFKKCFGQTPYQWMLERKMEEIQSLVFNSDISITEISRMYDFKSVSHLVNAYTKRFGISPHKSRLSNAI